MCPSSRVNKGFWPLPSLKLPIFGLNSGDKQSAGVLFSPQTLWDLISFCRCGSEAALWFSCRALSLQTTLSRASLRLQEPHAIPGFVPKAPLFQPAQRFTFNFPPLRAWEPEPKSHKISLQHARACEENRNWATWDNQWFEFGVFVWYK